MGTAWSLGRLWFRKILLHQSQQFFALNLLCFSMSFSSHTCPPILFKLHLCPQDFFILPPMPKYRYSLFYLPLILSYLSDLLFLVSSFMRLSIYSLSNFWAPIFFFLFHVFSQLFLVENGNSSPFYSPDDSLLTFFTQVLISKTGLGQGFFCKNLWVFLQKFVVCQIKLLLLQKPFWKFPLLQPCKCWSLSAGSQEVWRSLTCNYLGI